jgi:phosphoribosylformimino-5-aminoimidazole carboxamide ribotide isomerase
VRLYPAIDILGGRAVRLTRGDFDAGKVYEEDPAAAASEWVRQGAERLHVVDLDGARAGAPANLEHLRRIAAAADVPVQFGGGLRAPEDLERAFAAGAARVILGTAALTDPGLLSAALAEHGPERVLVSVDVRGGRPATAGWTESAEAGVAETLARLQDGGVSRLVYTNVDRDGMLEGPDVDEVRAVARAVRGELVYSGGISSLGDLAALAALAEPTLAGVIVGKALYEGAFTVADAMASLG